MILHIHPSVSEVDDQIKNITIGEKFAMFFIYTVVNPNIINPIIGQ